MRCNLALTLFALALPVRGAGQERQGGAWQVDQFATTLELDALNVVRVGALSFRPALYLRCLNDKLEVFVATGAAGARNPDYRSTVRLRWADRPPVEETWSRSTDYSVTFAPDAAAFVQQLLTTPEMTFEFRSESVEPVAARFNGIGLDTHLPQLRAKCPGFRSVPLRGRSDRVYAETEVDERPQLRSLPDPDYPAMLRRAEVKGTVVVQVVVDTLGRVEPGSAHVLSTPHPAFKDPAIRSAERGVFLPGRVRGRVVRSRTRLSVAFVNTKE